MDCHCPYGESAGRGTAQIGYSWRSFGCGGQTPSTHLLLHGLLACWSILSVKWHGMGDCKLINKSSSSPCGHTFFLMFIFDASTSYYGDKMTSRYHWDQRWIHVKWDFLGFPKNILGLLYYIFVVVRFGHSKYWLINFSKIFSLSLSFIFYIIKPLQDSRFFLMNLRNPLCIQGFILKMDMLCFLWWPVA